MQFDLPKEKSSIIKVIGIGGGGSNAVNYMYKQGIQGVNFVVCNTDAQALDLSPVPNKIQLGPHLTEGRGAGSLPDVGREATEESLEAIREILEINTKMVFITAGMGGGTGTGGAPVVAKAAKEMGILTVGIVTVPFGFEGKRRKQQATEGLEELTENVDTLIVISNDKLRDMYGNLKLSAAFSHADNVLTTASKGIAEIITVPGYINVDFEDVKTVMTNSGVAIMGTASAEGEHRALRAVEAALSSPLLSDNDIQGAKHILLNISSGDEEVLMDEIYEITEYVQEEAGHDTDIIWGNCLDENLGDKLSVTVIATGFEMNQEKKKANAPKKKIVRRLEEKVSGSIEHDRDYENQEEREPELKEEEEKNQYTFDFEVKNEQKSNPLENEDEEDVFTPELHSLDEDEKNEPYKEEEDEEGSLKGIELKQKSPSNNENEQMPGNDRQPGNDLRVHQDKERIRRLRGISMKFHNSSNLQDLENEPAYKRRNVNLNDVPHSSEQDISRYSLSERKDEQETERIQIRKNNSFLHDNVD